MKGREREKKHTSGKTNLEKIHTKTRKKPAATAAALPSCTGASPNVSMATCESALKCSREICSSDRWHENAAAESGSKLISQQNITRDSVAFGFTH